MSRLFIVSWAVFYIHILKPEAPLCLKQKTPVRRDTSQRLLQICQARFALVAKKPPIPKRLLIQSSISRKPRQRLCLSRGENVLRSSLPLRSAQVDEPCKCDKVTCRKRVNMVGLSPFPGLRPEPR